MTAAGRGVLFFPTGLYRYFDPRIRLTTSNTWIMGDSAELQFASTDTSKYGRILFDGGANAGTISNLGILGHSMYFREVSNTPLQGLNDPFGGRIYASHCSIVVIRGCDDFLIDGGVYDSSVQWTINVFRSRRGKIVNTSQINPVADGTHVQDACDTILIAHNSVFNTGDDAFAVDFDGAASRNIIIRANVAKEIGAAGCSVYAGNSGVTDNIFVEDNIFENLFGSGLSVVAATFSGDASSGGTGTEVAVGNIGKVFLRRNTIEGAGMRTLNAFSRARGASHGVNINPNGGSIAKVVLEGGSIDRNRNQFVKVHPGNLGTFINRGVDLGSIVATGGAGPAASGGGDNMTPTDTNYAPIRYSATGKHQQIAVTYDGNRLEDIPAPAIGSTLVAADNFDRPDVAPVSGGLGNTSTGGLTWTGSAAGIQDGRARLATGGFNQVQISVTEDGFDISVGVTITSAGNAARLIGNMPDGSQLILSTAGEFFYYDNGDQSASGLPGNAFPAKGAGTYLLRLKRVGNVATAYIDGAEIGTGSPSRMMLATSSIGFQDGGGAGGTARYDNFEYRTVD